MLSYLVQLSQASSYLASICLMRSRRLDVPQHPQSISEPISIRNSDEPLGERKTRRVQIEQSVVQLSLNELFNAR